MTEKTGKNLILVDTSSFLHRQYHGQAKAADPVLMPFKTRTIDISALKGYFEYIANKVYQEFEADQLIHVLDPWQDNSDSWRKQLYPPYKGERSETDEALQLQERVLPRILWGLGESYVSSEKEEADDLIATLARENAQNGGMTLILSGDKDLMQLVNDEHTVVCQYVKRTDGMGKVHEYFDSEAVIKKLGVRPEQVADYLALMGDAVDNIPGIPSVGPKTAADLIREYGDLDTLMTRSHEIKGKLGDKIREHKDQLPLFAELTRARDDLSYQVHQAYGIDELGQQFLQITGLMRMGSYFDRPLRTPPATPNSPSPSRLKP